MHLQGSYLRIPVRIKVRLVVYDVDDETEARTVRDIKEQDIYFGTLPLMTEREPSSSTGPSASSSTSCNVPPASSSSTTAARRIPAARCSTPCRVIPMRGSWLDFDFDHKDILYVRIDRRRKMPATILLKAMGMSKTEILDCFYKKEIYELEDDGRVSWHFNPELHRKEAAFADIVDKEGNVLVKAGKPITKRAWRQMEAAGVEKIEVAPETPLGLFLAEDLVDNATGEILAEAADEITAGLFDACREAGITTISALHTRGTDTSSSIRDTLVQDKTPTMEKAQEEIYRRLRPRLPADPGNRRVVLRQPVPQRRLLRPVARGPLQAQPAPEQDRSRRSAHPCRRRHPRRHQGACPAEGQPRPRRRHRPPRQPPRGLVGELVENQYRIGLVRMERAIKERMSIQEVATLMPHDPDQSEARGRRAQGILRHLAAVAVHGPDQLLSEVTHKRRLFRSGPRRV